MVDRILAGPRPLRIVAAGDPVLRQPAAPYDGELGEDRLRALLAAMRETLLATQGAVGLAAPQVGLPLNVAVMEYPPELAERVIEQGRPRCPSRC